MADADYTTLQKLLSEFFNNNYDVTDLMESLTPSCSEMFVRCKIQDTYKSCSELFVLTKTTSGFCCTFNYRGRPEDRAKSDNRTSMPETYIVRNVGRQSGLSVSIRPNYDDYAYTILPIIGWKVMIFNSASYPDPYSGGVFEVLVSPLTRHNVELYSVVMESTDTIRAYPIEKRGCIFSDEQSTFDDSYSYSECITSCKMRDIWKKCKCRPFFYPRFGSTEGRNMDLIPNHDKEILELIPNGASTLKCNCYPECNDVSYMLTTSAHSIPRGYTETPLLNWTKSYLKCYSPGINVTDESVLNVYFSEMESLYMKQDETYRWYEYISDAGGLCGLIIGFSMVSVMEIIYFLLLFIFELCGFPTNTTRMKEDSNKEIMLHPLYWNELYPRPRSDRRIYRRNNVRY
ncbi:pickpocket protein 28-like [Megachile rotundata]|uniref:pickpocket protein 28-like n=1 Tax=Megachile rotundata TaxID=143995 RepID=UPI003FD4197E